MNHLDDTVIMSLRDREQTEPAAREHARECDACEQAVRRARARETIVRDALSSLDGPVDVDGAKAAVRSRLDAARDTGARQGRRMSHLGRAAAILLLAAGAVSALPGSPIRRLWQRAPEPTAGSTTGTFAPPQSAGPAGIAVPVPDGRIRVVVRNADPGSELNVVWSDGSTARITAPAGSSFSYTDGRAEVVPSAGDVTVELPRAASAVSVEVDGRTYVAGSGRDPVISRAPIESGTERIRFRIPDR